ncbi:MAG: hypothetical protein FWF02_06845 [Micrococcales bacterium]|nr:hypothetical protein [Micrococcales bacterium]MCL2667410.1 hypothetical protein [Micrococcales bacterium]
MTELRFDTIARHNVDTYKATDPLLWSQLEKVLTAIAEDQSLARSTALRVLGTTVWSIEVHVSGRDDTYQIVWAPDPTDSALAHVHHLGPELT